MVDGKCQECDPYTIVSEDEKKCIPQYCIDVSNVINSSGECHDYDPTLEPRHI